MSLGPELLIKTLQTSIYIAAIMQRLWSTTCRHESIFSKGRNRVLIKLNSQSRNGESKCLASCRYRA
jgi:hypothetical protein